MAADRTAFLDRVRLAMQDAEDTHISWNELLAPCDDDAFLNAFAQRGPDEQQILLQTLVEQARQLHLQTHLCPTLDQAAQCIAEITLTSVPEFTAEPALILHDHPLLRALPLHAQPAINRIPRHWTVNRDPEVRNRTLAASIGVTVADWGIAESATIVQMTRPGRPRSTSLVPSIHIAVLPLSHLTANLAEAYALVRREQDSDSWTLISGPSKTADIEAVMVHGAHGPRAMHLIVLTEPVIIAPSGFPVASSLQSC